MKILDKLKPEGNFAKNVYWDIGLIRKINHTPNIIHDKVQTHSFKGLSNYIKIFYNFIFRYA